MSNNSEIFAKKEKFYINEVAMQVILVVIPTLSLIFAAVGGRMGEMSSAMLAKSGEAVELVISLCVIICFWSGIMSVAQR